MKFRVNREKLNKALQKVGTLTGGNSIMPLLNNVLLKAQDGLLELTTSDCELRMNTSIEAEIEVPGTTTAPAKKLSSLTASLNGENIEFDVDENDHIKIVCGTGRYRLLGLPSADYPAEVPFTAQRELTIKESDFKALHDAICYAVSKDSNRKSLTGVFFNAVGGSLTMVATDGKRMALQEKVLESMTGEDGCAIVPLKAVADVSKMLEGSGTLKIAIGDKHCSFEGNNFRLDSKLIEGAYPNYKSVVPQSFERIITLPVDPLLAKVETVSLLLPDNTHSVILNFTQGKVSIEASSTQLGDGSDYVEVDYQDDPFEVSFNPVFLKDPLKTTSAETISFKLNDPLNPVALEAEEGFINVIMPIRKKPAAQ